MEAATMPMRSLWGFGPEALAEMAEILNAAYNELQGTSERDIVRERIATRIIAAASRGKRDRGRLLEAALRTAD
jgi:hypothetical protein